MVAGNVSRESLDEVISFTAKQQMPRPSTKQERRGVCCVRIGLNPRGFYLDSLMALKAQASWSGHDVGLLPQRIPSRVSMTSAIRRPLTNAAMPWRLP